MSQVLSTSSKVYTIGEDESQLCSDFRLREAGLYRSVCTAEHTNCSGQTLSALLQWPVPRDGIPLLYHFS